MSAGLRARLVLDSLVVRSVTAVGASIGASACLRRAGAPQLRIGVLDGQILTLPNLASFVGGVGRSFVTTTTAWPHIFHQPPARSRPASATSTMTLSALAPVRAYASRPSQRSCDPTCACQARGFHSTAPALKKRKGNKGQGSAAGRAQKKQQTPSSAYQGQQQAQSAHHQAGSAAKGNAPLGQKQSVYTSGRGATAAPTSRTEAGEKQGGGAKKSAGGAPKGSRKSDGGGHSSTGRAVGRLAACRAKREVHAGTLRARALSFAVGHFRANEDPRQSNGAYACCVLYAPVDTSQRPNVHG